jgi:hypothetical protein
MCLHTPAPIVNSLSIYGPQHHNLLNYNGFVRPATPFPTNGLYLSTPKSRMLTIGEIFSSGLIAELIPLEIVKETLDEKKKQSTYQAFAGTDDCLLHNGNEHLEKKVTRRSP